MSHGTNHQILLVWWKEKFCKIEMTEQGTRHELSSYTIEEGNIKSQPLSLLNANTVVLVRSRPLDRKTKSMKIE